MDIFFTLMYVLSFHSAIILASPLDNLNVNTSTIAVSGFSSGGCFATQFHTAFSASISGMGSFSGCPYISAWIDDDAVILAETINLAEMGAIDPLENLTGDKIYIFQGLVDTIVPWTQAGRIQQFYAQFTAEDNILEKSDLESEHGFPSDSYGGICEHQNAPLYINNCQYNGADSVINHTISSFNLDLKESGQSLTGFDQNEFYDNDARGHGMDDNGYVFIPTRCEDGSLQCHLHVHFHGCGMESGWLGDNFIQNSAFLRTAEANDVIIIFPQIRHSVFQGNPSGCWDWWGYLGDGDGFQYATKEGKQMKGIANMVERTASVSLF